jgi:hypothetical protein
MLRSEMTQREARMSASFDQHMHSLQQRVDEFRQEVAGIVKGASAQIATEAKDAVAPVASEYGRAVSATSAHLQAASKTVWMWFATTRAIGKHGNSWPTCLTPWPHPFSWNWRRTRAGRSAWWPHCNWKSHAA